MSTGRRTRRPSHPVDVAAYQELIEKACEAFTEDVSYAVAMARSAVAITRKRDMWQARRELRTAEAAAHQQCNEHDFDCHAVSPCGTGDCKFATGEYAQLHVSAPGTSSRVQNRSTGAYSLEPAVTALAERRLRSL